MSTAPEPEAGNRRRVLRATGVVGSMTLLSRVFGLVRDMVLSRLFDASGVLDAFFVAFKIPNLLRRFFAEGAFAQAFVPVLSEYRARREAGETRALVAAASGTLGLVLLAITAVGVIAAPLLIFIFAPGFADDDDGRARYELAVDMLRWTFPYLLFISLTGLAGGVLNTYRRFTAPAFTPVLLNLVLIGFALWVTPGLERPGIGLAIGVFVAGLVQLLFQIPFLGQLGMLPAPRWAWREEPVRRIIRLMLPVMFGSSIAQINLLFDTLIASFLAAGSITWLYYSDRLMEFPLGVFGIALATVILPGLSEQHAREDAGGFSATIDWALRLTLIIAAPAAVGLVMLARPLIATLFFGGEFDAHDVAMAEASLIAYGLGLMGFILVKVLVPGYFARQDTRTPVRIGVTALVVNMVLNVVFVVTLVRTNFAAPHAGLAAATTCSALLNAWLLYRGLRRLGVYQPVAGWSRLGFQVTFSVALMAGFLMWLESATGDWLAASVLDRIFWLSASVVGGAVVYFAALLVAGLRPTQLHGPRH